MGPMDAKRTMLTAPVSEQLKQQIKDAAEAAGVTQAVYVRDAVLAKLGQVPGKLRPKATPERTKRNDFYLQPTEREHFKQHARERGYASWQELALTMLRAEVYGRPVVAPVTAKEIASNNFHLAAVGKNLNQIARAINTAATVKLEASDVAKLDDVLRLATAIQSHLDMSVAALASTTRRFS